MFELRAQGDILIECLPEIQISGTPRQVIEADVLTIARGEASGHSHRLVGNFSFYRDDALARDIPDRLYLGHIDVGAAAARLEHEEHAPIALEQGCYRLRRQRRLDPNDISILEE